MLEGQSTCGGEDFLTECKEWCEKLNIPCVTKGVPKNIKKRCDLTKEIRANLNLGKEEDKVVLWRKITCALRKLYTNKDVNEELSKNNETDFIAKESVNMLSPDRVKETYQRLKKKI